MAEIALNVCKGQCFNSRMNTMETVRDEARTWCEYRNNMEAKINGQLTTADARIKLKSPHPKLET